MNALYVWGESNNAGKTWENCFLFLGETGGFLRLIPYNLGAFALAI